MFIFAVALGLVGCVLFIILTIIQILRGKKCTGLLAGFALCLVLLLGGGYLFSMTDGAPPVEEKKPASTHSAAPVSVDKTPQEPVSQPTTVPNEKKTETEKDVLKPDSLEPVEGDNQISESTVGGQLGEYYVEIKNAAIVKDHKNNPSIIITYSWTNNSNETTSAEGSLMEKAFQDGVQLDTVFVENSPIYNSDLSFKEIRPGASLDVQCAFELPNEHSVVEFELSEFFSLSDDVVKKDFDPATLSK